MTANPLSSIPPIGSPSGMPQPPGSGRFRPIDPLRVVRQHMVLLIAAGVVGLALGVGTFFLLRQVSPTYASIAQLRATGQLTDPDKTVTDESTREDVLERYIANEIARITSEELLRQAVARPSTQQTEWYRSFNGDTRAAVQELQRGQLGVNSLRGTSLIQLRVRTSNPDDPRPILQDIVDVYLDQLRLETSRSTQDIREVFRRQRDQALDEIARLEQQISQFTQSEGLTTAAGGSHEATIEYQRYSELKSDLNLAITQARTSLENLQEQARSNNYEPSAEAITMIEQRPAVAERDQQVRRAEENLATARAHYPENHRYVRQLRQRLEEVEALREQSFREETQKYLQAQMQQASQQVSGLEAQLAEVESKLRAAEQRKLDLADRMARLEQLKEDLELAKMRREDSQARIEETNLISVRPDAVPVKPQIAATEPELVFPKVTVVVPGVTMLVLGLVGGLVFVRELLDQRLKSPADVRTMTGGELLGTVPSALDDPSGCREVERCVSDQPSGLMAEAFRQVRTAILSKMDRRGYKTLALVGGQPASGVSSVTHNLASSLALNGRNVLVIDANFRRPRQHRTFECGGECGLVDVLNGDRTAEQAIHRVEGLSLSILPAGRSGEAAPELLERQAFRSLLSKLETEYDAVLIDAPPALITSEAQLLAKQVDALAVVVRADRDKKGMVDRLLRELDGHRADVMGVILNGVRASAGGYYRRSYEAFYRYRDQSGDAAAPRGSSDASGGGRLGPSDRGDDLEALADSSAGGGSGGGSGGNGDHKTGG